MIGAVGNVGALYANVAALESAVSATSHYEVPVGDLRRLSEAYKPLCELLGTQPMYTDPQEKARFTLSVLAGCESTHNERDGEVRPAKWKPVYAFSRRLRRAVSALMRRHNRKDWS